MSGLFSKNNLLLCCMQGNNGLSAKTLKNFQSHLHSNSVLTFDKHQICSASCCILEQQNKQFVIQILYLMVLLCVILKGFDMRGILSAPASDVHVRLKTTYKAILKIARETADNQ